MCLSKNQDTITEAHHRTRPFNKHPKQTGNLDDLMIDLHSFRNVNLHASCLPTILIHCTYSNFILSNIFCWESLNCSHPQTANLHLFMRLYAKLVMSEYNACTHTQFLCTCSVHRIILGRDQLLSQVPGECAIGSVL